MGISTVHANRNKLGMREMHMEIEDDGRFCCLDDRQGEHAGDAERDGSCLGRSVDHQQGRDRTNAEAQPQTAGEGVRLTADEGCGNQLCFPTGQRLSHTPGLNCPYKNEIKTRW